MTPNNFLPSNIFDDEPSSHRFVYDLVRRLQLFPSVLRRQQEEDLIRLVPIEPEFLEEQRSKFLSDLSLEQVLHDYHWISTDLDLHLVRLEVLRRFAEQRFGPGLEEVFLSADGGHDQVIYSLLRVREPALAQELWIRLEEGEATFSEVASTYGEGPEASRNGLMGPLPMGNITPVEIASLLRTLQIGQITSPIPFGEWFVLLRLEQLTPARFDPKMRQFLLDQQLNAFLEARVQSILCGESLEPLNFDSFT